jgi:glucose-1-phosphate cytidylyltransferase
MKVVILCGGLGTRLSEETHLRPKPMVEIGDKPILWHIMKIYEKFGLKDFLLPLGYKGDYIKNFFLNYYNFNSDLFLSLGNNLIERNNNAVENWNLSLVDTGLNTMTGGRLLRLKEYLKNSGTFMLTYGDGVSNIDISKLLTFHRSHGKLATVTAVRPPVRFGELVLNNSKVERFEEKPQAKDGWVNGGFFVFEPEIFDLIKDDSTILEREPLEELARRNELMAFQHEGFWQCMDTIRDKDYLQNLWIKGEAPWM